MINSTPGGNFTPTELHIDSPAIPLWKGAPGFFSVQANVASPTDPFPVSPTALSDARLHLSQNIGFAAEGAVTLGLDAQTSCELAPLWQEQTGADPTLVEEFDLAPELTPGNVLLVLDIGAQADLRAAGSFPYAALTAGATLDAGAGARFVATRSFPRNQPSLAILQDFFHNLSLPGAVHTPPPPGALTSLEFGGYLNWGISAAAGYEIKGTPSFAFSEIALSEHYGLSVTGKLSVAAKLAGRFSVEVRRADDHWARITVRRRRSRDLSVAADLGVSASVNTAGLPPSGKEFVEALLGLRAKNWLNLADSLLSQSAQIHNAQDLTGKLDGLATIYLSRFANRALGDLSSTEVSDLMARLQKVVTSYRNLDQSAITLFDRYFDSASSELVPALQKLRTLTNGDQLPGEIPPALWNAVQQFTGSDSLASLVGDFAPDLQQRVTDTLSLMEDDAHTQIRNYIALARNEFGLDHFITELDQVDTPEKLAALLSDSSQHIAERILGVVIGNLEGSQRSDAFHKLTKFVQHLKPAEDSFFRKFDSLLSDAASQSITLSIQAAYQQADDSRALIDLDLRLLNDDGTPCAPGQKLMKSAGLGDFSTILADYQPGIVRLRSGDLTHRIASSAPLKVNVAGWHREFHYQEMYSVVVNSDQQIRPTASGMLNVFTTVDMTTDHSATRKTSKAEQEMHSNFTLRFLAETRNVVSGSSFDLPHRQYLIDVITGQVATYRSSFSDSAITPPKLDQALSFAKYLRLDAEGATAWALQPFLQLHDGNYGPFRLDYSVRFSEAGLRNLFQSTVTEDQIRGILRALVVANYSGDPVLSSAAWLYSSDEVRRLQALPAFLQSATLLLDALNQNRITVESPIPGIGPPRLLQTDPATRNAVVAFFAMEAELIDAIRQLQEILHRPGSLHDLESRLNGFGKALNTVDKAVGNGATAVSPEFALFDHLIALTTPAAQARSSILHITLGAAATRRNLLFQFGAQPAARTLTAGAPLTAP